MRILLTLWMCLAFALADAARAENFGFGSLRQLLDSGRISTIEELIAAMPQDLRTHYALVFSSRSLQDASFANPRVILFGTTAQLIVTFNGDASAHGYAAVETMEFDTHTNRFMFREITFSPGEGEGPAGATISEPNPARCVACHDRPARPIWDAPPSWPGVYGERYRAGLSPAEMTGMREFLSTRPTHPRYRHLLGAAAFADRETYVLGARGVYNGASIEPPNAQLSALLTALNMRSILSELAGAPAFSAHRYVLLATAGANCGALEEFYPAAMRSAMNANFKEFAAMTARADHRQSDVKSLRRAGRGNQTRVLASPTELTALRFVVERGLSIPTQHWTLALERGTYDFSAPDGTLTLEQALFERLARSDSALFDLAQYRTFAPEDAYCKHLRRESRQALSTWYGMGKTSAHQVNREVEEAAAAPLEIDSLEAPPPLLERCTACHSTEVAPPLPFDDPGTLAPLLLGGHYPRGRLLDEILFRLTPQAAADRMPRGIDISSIEQHQFEDYFLSLARSAAPR
jgi:hypothetical protein